MKKTLTEIATLLVLATCAQAAAPTPLNERQARPSPDWVTRGVMYQIQPRAFTPEGTLKAATALAHPPLVANAAAALGRLQAQLHDPNAADTIEQAARAAAEARDDALSAECWILLVQVVGGDLRRFDEALADDVVDRPRPQARGQRSPGGTLLFGGGREQVTDVWVAGQHLLKERRLTTLDGDDILERARAWQANIGK